MTNQLGLGTWQFGKHFWGDVKDEESLDIIKTAIENEITLIDTAPVYGDGHAEEIVGKGIKGQREKVFLATKCGLIHNKKGFFHDLTPSSLEKELSLSLKRLNVDYLDLYQIHWPDKNYSTDKAIETLLKFKEKELIKNVGVCNLTIQELEKLELLSELKSVQIQYSLLDYPEQKPIMDFCKNYELLSLTYGTFQGGLLLDKYSSIAEIPQKSAKNFFYQGKDPTNWLKIQTIISEQKALALKNNVSLPQQILASTQQLSNSSFTLIGCRTVKQLTDNLSMRHSRLRGNDR
ncbi:MAG: aldo/keto reductase [Candidatus Margulisbacteria bacterium]|nr:aldo/keto reductase [Candidatus Margulisiibacteriota bacterium]